MSKILKNEEAIVNDLLLSLGEWCDTVVIGGGYALIIYRLYFSDKNASLPVATKDIDSILPRKIYRHHSKTLSQRLSEAGFIREYKDFEQPPTELYRKIINNDEIEIEFLTDKNTRRDKNKNVSISGVIAQPLSYIEMSYENILNFSTNSDLQGKVVDPASWIFHKMLTFVRRNRKLKAYKDLYGIWYAASQLGVFSHEVCKKFTQLRKEKPAWFKTAKTNILEWTESASIEDWTHLELQDPPGNLKKAGFERIIQILTS